MGGARSTLTTRAVTRAVAFLVDSLVVVVSSLRPADRRSIRYPEPADRAVRTSVVRPLAGRPLAVPVLRPARRLVSATTDRLVSGALGANDCIHSLSASVPSTEGHSLDPLKMLVKCGANMVNDARRDSGREKSSSSTRGLTLYTFGWNKPDEQQ